MASYDWLSLSTSVGAGTGTVTATVLRHYGSAPRTKKISVAATINGTTTHKYVDVDQAGSSITGSGVLKFNNTEYTGNTSISPSQLPKDSVSLGITNTNATNFEYYVLVTGSMKAASVFGILAEPTIDASISSIVDGSTIKLTSLTSSTENTSNGFKITYSLSPTDAAKGVGRNQTYSFDVNSDVVKTYTNNSSQDVLVQYGINAVMATDVSGIGTTTTSVPLKSFVVTYPASSTTFNVSTTGMKFGAGTTSQSFTIYGPSDMTWEAQISK